MAIGKADSNDLPGGPELPGNLRQDLTRALAADVEGRERACEALSQLYPEHGLEIRRILGLQPGSIAASEEGIRVLEPLGKGSLGEIYLAERPADGIQPGLRRLRLGLDQGRLLILREGKPGALAALADPVLAADSAFETRPGYPRYLLEELQAQPITEYCDRHALSIAARIDLIRQASAGVRNAHQRGLCHLDLKPSNIVVDDRVPPARVRILHFGMAGEDAGDEASVSFLGDRYLGSPRYMSPEQAGRGGNEPDVRSDIYSLAAVLYELLVGFPPRFPNLVDDLPLDEMQRIVRDQPAPLASQALRSHPHLADLAKARGIGAWQLRRTLCGDLDSILDKALASLPDNRYPSMDAFAADLDRYRGLRAVEARNENAFECLARIAKRRARALSTVLLLVLAGSAGYWTSTIDQPPAGTASTGDLDNESQELGKVASPTANSSLRKELLRSEARVLQLEVDGLIASAEGADVPAKNLGLKEQSSALRAWLGLNADPLTERATRIDDLLAPEQLAALGNQELAEALELARNRIRNCLARTIQPPRRHLAWIESRLSWLDGEAQISLDQYAERWQNSIRAVASSPRYAGLELSPQAGLIPLGRDPRSGLYEFFHPGSAGGDRSLPAPDTNGNLRIDGESGVVFVLIPAASLTLGAQAGDPRAANYAANYQESPDHVPAMEIDIPAFFLGKYELTQGQWQSLAGEAPALYAADLELPSGERIKSNHPVESVEAEEAWRVLDWAGLRLPSEAEWEYAAIGGSEWQAVPDQAGLEDRANLSDLSVERLQPWSWDLHRELLRLPHLRSRWPSMDSFDDGFVVHAPVGSLEANGFGLHDMQGNVAEWCEGWTEAGADEQFLPRGDHFLSRRPSPFWRRDSLARGIQGGLPHIGLRAARSIKP